MGNAGLRECRDRCQMKNFFCGGALWVQAQCSYSECVANKSDSLRSPGLPRGCLTKHSSSNGQIQFEAEKCRWIANLDFCVNSEEK